MTWTVRGLHIVSYLDFLLGTLFVKNRKAVPFFRLLLLVFNNERRERGSRVSVDQNFVAAHTLITAGDGSVTEKLI